MKTYIAELSIVGYNNYYICYTFFDGDKEVGMSELKINEDVYNLIITGKWKSDFHFEVDDKEIKHAYTEGECYHGTWKNNKQPKH